MTLTLTKDCQIGGKWREISLQILRGLLNIQDRVIATRNYLKDIIKYLNSPEADVEDVAHQEETIDHSVSACLTLAQSDYLKRNNNVAKIIHLELLKHRKVSTQQQNHQPHYYSHAPKSVIETENIKIYYDRIIHISHTREHNRPHITTVDKRTKSATLTDITIPLSCYMIRTHYEKNIKILRTSCRDKNNVEFKQRPNSSSHIVKCWHHTENPKRIPGFSTPKIRCNIENAESSCHKYLPHSQKNPSVNHLYYAPAGVRFLEH